VPHAREDRMAARHGRRSIPPSRIG
jgi:hypothetical protein